MNAPREPQEQENEATRLERLRLEAMRRELSMRRPPDPHQGRASRAASGKTTTILLVLLSILGALYVLKLAWKSVDASDAPRRPGVGRSR